MGYQRIAGIKIKAQGGRFGNQTFPEGRAFGGWIYGGNLQMGFADSPTTLSLDIALDTQTDGTELLGNDGSVAGIGFDINSGDLRVNHTGVEQYYTITIGSTEFGPMYLTSYDINGATDSKTLKVEFTDYSMVLDKVYVGLFKREGYISKHKKTIVASPEIFALCPDCSVSSTRFFTVRGFPIGTIETAAYFINHYHPGGRDLLVQANPSENYSSYSNRAIKNSSAYATMATFSNQFAPSATAANSLNINGGTLIIGTEEFNENACADASNISYNFSELLQALARLNLKFTKVNSSILANSYLDIDKTLDKNRNYRQTYNGTLREVLNNWCADFGLNFYIFGKTIHFIDVSAGVNLQGLKDVMVPTNPLGQVFNSNTNFAIGNFSEKFNIKETYAQVIVTSSIRSRSVNKQNKQLKNVCGFTVTHPLDWLNPNRTPFASHETMYGQPFTAPYFINDYKKQNNRDYFIIDGKKNITHWFSNRSLTVIDTCAALINYNENIRDIYAGALITYSEMGDKISKQNGFNSFAFVPVLYLEGEQINDIKSFFLEKNFAKDTPNGVAQNNILAPEHFNLYVGFHDPKRVEEIKSWEKAIASKIGKYGILNKASLPHHPYLPLDRVDQPSFFVNNATAGKYMKVNSTTNPSSDNRMDYASDDFFLSDIFKASGNYASVLNDFSGLYVAQLDNEWGTKQEDFNLQLKELNRFQASTDCDNFKDIVARGQDHDDSTAPASFDLNDFTPKLIKLEEDDMDDLQEFLTNSINGDPSREALLAAVIDKKKETRSQNKIKQYSDLYCPKLYLLAIPRVGYPQGASFTNSEILTLCPHLQIEFGFTQPKRNDTMVIKLNKFSQDKEREKKKRFPKNVCDDSLLDTICASGVLANQKDCPDYSPDPNCKCPSPASDFFSNFNPGFSPDVVMNRPCRNINLILKVNHLTHNYVQTHNANNPVLKDDSFKGLSVIHEGESAPQYTKDQTQIDITYPIDSYPLIGSGFNYYNGILDQDVEMQLRSAERIEIYGSSWAGTDNVAKVQRINNEVGQDIQNQIDPQAKGFFSPVYDMQNNRLNSVADYHRLIESLSNSQNLQSNHEINFEIIGDATLVNTFRDYLTPTKGLKSLNFSLGQEGFRTNVSFANIPVKPPKKEAILNKISARLDRL